MARQNRLVVLDGCYHVTTRIANRQFFLRDPLFRYRIIDWVYGIADFSGVEVIAWCVMENHLHLYLHVPTVPTRLWTTPPGTLPTHSTLPLGTVPTENDAAMPQTAAFSMRPRECRAPRWTPDITSDIPAITPNGEKPSIEAVRTAVADGVPLAILPRPETGFSLSDDEMISRLQAFYRGYSRGADKIARRWAQLRENKQDEIVEAEKDSLCRRMYNISQYMKMLKQRISEVYNRETKHTGVLWEGRFYSVLVGDTRKDRLFVSSYIAWNPMKPRLVKDPKDWAWSSYAAAINPASPYHARARATYEQHFNQSWDEIQKAMEVVFAEELAPNFDPYKDALDFGSKPRLTMGQLIKTKVRMFERGGYISQDLSFVERVRAQVAKNFPMPSDRSIRFFAAFKWRHEIA